MATSSIFSDPSINLNISPFSIYVLLGKNDNLKNREILKKIEKRKTVTGNIFSVKAVRKDLVVEGQSRKALKNALGKANIIAEILNPGSSVPEYLYNRIDYDPDNIENSSNQIRGFIKDLCERDIEYLKKNNNTYLISAKNELIQRLISLKEYLSTEIIKSAHILDKRLPKESYKQKIKNSPSNFRNGLPENLKGRVLTGQHPMSFQVAEPEYYQERDFKDDKLSFSKKPLLKVLSEIGWSYEYFKDKIRKAGEESIINTQDLILRIKQKSQRERCPKIELEINKNKRIPITIGTKPGSIFYGSILVSMYEGNRFKRSDLIEVVENVKNKCKEKGTLFFSEHDYDSIPNLRRFEKLYKALLGKNSVSFVYWCNEEFTSRSLDTGASHIRRNIKNKLKDEDLSEIKDLLLIQKKTIYDKTSGSHNNVYWIELPIEQVDFSSEIWDDLKKELNKTNSSRKNSLRE